jgi:hypothetical protein
MGAEQIRYLVLEDPKAEYWEGALVDSKGMRELEERGAITIPTVPELSTRNAVAGFMKRSWGSGWKLPDVIPNRICPTILFTVPNLHVIHWRAKLVREPNAAHVNGTVRLTGDSAQIQASIGGMGQSSQNFVDLAKLNGADDPESEGWFIGGQAPIAAQLEGYMGICLYGMGTGIRVAWLAVSQSY